MAAWASQGAKPRRQLLPRSFWKELAPRTARLQSSDSDFRSRTLSEIKRGLFQASEPVLTGANGPRNWSGWGHRQPRWPSHDARAVCMLVWGLHGALKSFLNYRPSFKIITPHVSAEGPRSRVVTPGFGQPERSSEPGLLFAWPFEDSFSSLARRHTHVKPGEQERSQHGTKANFSRAQTLPLSSRTSRPLKNLIFPPYV